MADQKTVPTPASVASYLDTLEEAKRADSERLCALMSSVTGEPPTMWGTSIVGFGSYHYRYASGHEGDAPVVSFAPRAKAFTLYLSCDISAFQHHLDRLGKHRTGKGCLYVHRLADVDVRVLEELVRDAASSVKSA